MRTLLNPICDVVYEIFKYLTGNDIIKYLNIITINTEHREEYDKLISEIKIFEQDFDTRLIAHLSNLTTLKYLNLSRSYLTDWHNYHIHMTLISRMSNLEYLNLDRCHDLKEIDIINLDYLTRLTYLNLRLLEREKFNTTVVTWVLSKNFSKSLKHLCLDNHTITTEGMNHICSLSQLTYLDLSYCTFDVFGFNRSEEKWYKFSDRYLNMLDEFKLYNVTNLKLVCTPIYKNSFNKWLSKFKNLKYLDVRHCDTIESFYEIIPQIEHLIFGCCEFFSISKINSLYNLQKLEIENYKLNDGDTELISNLTKLQELRISNTIFNTNQISNILHKMSNLISLNLKYTNINDIDLKCIGMLTNLEELNLSNCVQITDLSYLISLTNLQRLNLNFCTSLKDNLNIITQLTNLHIVCLN